MPTDEDAIQAHYRALQEAIDALITYGENPEQVQAEINDMLDPYYPEEDHD